MAESDELRPQVVDVILLVRRASLHERREVAVNRTGRVTRCLRHPRDAAAVKFFHRFDDIE